MQRLWIVLAVQTTPRRDDDTSCMQVMGSITLGDPLPLLCCGGNELAESRLVRPSNLSVKVAGLLEHDNACFAPRSER